MKNIILATVILITAFFIQGCKKNMDYEPSDFFEGKQLEIAEAIYNGNEEGLRKNLPLISKEELNRPAKAEMTLLFWSMMATFNDNATPDRLHIITDLIQAGADPLQPQPKVPGSPAEFAMKSDKDIWIKAMLEGGLSPNARDKIHHKPIIFRSIMAKNTQTLKTVLDYGANINIQDPLGDTVLIDAMYAQSYDHVILLLQRGADSSIKGNLGWTMGNQLQRDLDEGIGNSEDRKKLELIKTLLIKNGGEWPPKPVKK
ncbi:ankyrin repeat domain-containing protein [Pluralibacter gergoviae]|uniref:Ankyrin repeat domain-containing protein n=1 Tax=Pluralibacter gergoviae TaxID=61647 RepID=A0AAI9DIQ7_PLUGE|nr:ankyrin repeat domain-containing protein [Pluralibacter gergoviae]EKV0914418.1 ankyrin repeat domain-containing protein [Pluralibacter gergoviae]EKV9910180.1 ankyrin repeat domain-containing protein [Pluralibacter gergoviae]EKW7276845.1 ankyrin repeat domain-containing protein [Pluralibacter gergoviae]ELD4293367.1 ankyrin repeat domain-containing protein [Pluralibacter gergoviae]ELD4304145.1 ankyrin repeat domain-containing protein [Pluralibacter gergoviae]